MDFTQLIELYGLPGLIIGGLAYAWRAERQERMALHQERREEMREMFAVVETLKSALTFVEGRK